MGISWLDEDSDRIHMQLALEQAKAAEQDGEVPVGAVIVHPEKGVIGQARNAKETLRDPTAHAEILAIGQAAEAIDGWRLDGTTLFCTLEPCPMCAGAILQARIARVVFGATDSRWGAVDTKLRIFEPGLFNHDVSWSGGLFGEESGELLRCFFQQRRDSSGKK
ncbi:MAG: tRNA-specific adenosine deaminase [Bacillota bacterium]|nr:MAG: tRNA-specific adenosine deaminase [Planctomycetota bacterium]RUA10691.1 MAG: tRNA-specific adenosine deaminase [Bacillota bacterium]